MVFKIYLDLLERLFSLIFASALFFSRHFIMEEVFVPTNQNPSFCLYHWNPGNFVSHGNQSIQFNKGKMKLRYSGSFNFSLVKVNWLITLRDNLTWFQCQRQNLGFLLVCTKTFYHNEMPTKIQSQI